MCANYSVYTLMTMTGNKHISISILFNNSDCKSPTRGRAPLLQVDTPAIMEELLVIIYLYLQWWNKSEGLL
jgi:hypothetical protein